MIQNTKYLQFTIGGIALIIAIPLIAIFVLALFPEESMWKHYLSTVFPGYLVNTLIYTFGTCILATVLGTLSAWIVSVINIPSRKILQWALLFPFAIPAYVVAFVYAEFFEYSGLVQTIYRAIFGYTSYTEYSFFDFRTMWGAVFVSAIVMYPYVYLMARASFIQQSGYVLEITKVMGHSATSSFFKVSLPIALPSIFVGSILVLMETMGDFGVVSLFGIHTLTFAIYDVWLEMNDVGFASQIALVMLIFVFLLLYMDKFYRNKQSIYLSTNSLVKPYKLIELSKYKKILSVVFCWGLVFMGFVIPAGILLDYSIRFFEQAYTSKYTEYLLNSLSLASLGVVIVMFFSILLGYYSRAKGHLKINNALIAFARSGYAVPGGVFAIGVFIPFANFDNLIDGIMIEYFNISTGLLLSGGTMLLIYAYVAKFINVGVGSVENSLQRVSYTMDDVAKLMGHSKLNIISKIHFPLIKTGLISGAIIVFVDIVKELPATLLLRPFNYETLATYVYQFASDDLIEQASIGALIMVALGMIPVIILSYFTNRKVK
ncbi:MAG: ABC transporter permease [Alphaproteobacteria bacterium]